MKQSGIDWIGEIPDDWKIEKFGHVLKERNEKNNPIISTERLSVSIDIGVTLYSDKTTNLDRFKDDFSQYKIAHEGDLVMPTPVASARRSPPSASAALSPLNTSSPPLMRPAAM